MIFGRTRPFFSAPRTLSLTWLLHGFSYGVLQCIFVEIDFELTDGGLSCLSVFLASCKRNGLFLFVEGNDAISLQL